MLGGTPGTPVPGHRNRSGLRVSIHNGCARLPATERSCVVTEEETISLSIRELCWNLHRAGGDPHRVKVPETCIRSREAKVHVSIELTITILAIVIGNREPAITRHMQPTATTDRLFSAPRDWLTTGSFLGSVVVPVKVAPPLLEALTRILLLQAPGVFTPVYRLIPVVAESPLGHSRSSHSSSY